MEDTGLSSAQLAVLRRFDPEQLEALRRFTAEVAAGRHVASWFWQLLKAVGVGAGSLWMLWNLFNIWHSSAHRGG